MIPEVTNQPSGLPAASAFIGNVLPAAVKWGARGKLSHSAITRITRGAAENFY